MRARLDRPGTLWQPAPIMTTCKRKVTLVVDALDAEERLDLFLARSLGVSRKAIKRALDGGQVFVSGQSVRRASFALTGGETVVVTLELPQVSPPAELVVLFRDDHLLAVNKPAGLPSHATDSGGPDALSLLAARLRGEGVVNPPILLHRLDADTSGVLLFALSAEANRDLARQFSQRQAAKTYLALVAGAPPQEFRVENRLLAGVRGRTVPSSKGLLAQTDFRTLAQGTGYALVEACPHTGRTHQIRAHLAGAGHPLLGDARYGGASVLAAGTLTLAAPRHLLHASRLAFRHPASGEIVSLTAPLPADFEPFLTGVSLPEIADLLR